MRETKKREIERGRERERELERGLRECERKRGSQKER